MKSRLASNAPRTLLRAALRAAVLVCLYPASAWAANATVDCTGGTPGAFTTITAALATLDDAGPHTVIERHSFGTMISYANSFQLTHPPFVLGGQSL